MKHNTIAIYLVLCVVGAHAAGPYEPNWASLDSRPLPQWFDDAKFGIFIHWGVYSVPSWSPVGAYAEWYWNALNTPGSETQAFHNKTYGPNFKYPDFVDRFTAELFDADVWANLIASSGAKYVVPTSKHHEGFTLWPSPQSWNWNAVDSGPHRNLLLEIMTAVRKVGLHAGLYFSLFEWYHPLYIGPNPQLYVDQIMLPQLYDLVNNYRPELIWGDGAFQYPSSFWRSPDFIAWLYNNSTVKDYVVINDRWGSETPTVNGGFFTPEYSSKVYANHKWEENSGIDLRSYGYNRNTPANLYITPHDLVYLLVRSVAFGGNLLLDIGPAADGRIPAIMQERLLSMGDWLSVNGDAIYSTRVWRVQQEVILTQPIQFSSVVTNANNVYGEICALCNTSTIFYAGNTNTNAACQAICKPDVKCLSYVWYSPVASNGDYVSNCYLRYDDVWTPYPGQPGVVSGRKDRTTVFYTSKTDKPTNVTTIFAIFTAWPPQNTLTLSSPIPSSKTTITFLGADLVKWNGQVGKAGMTVVLPQFALDAPPCQYAWTLKLEFVS